MNSVLSASSRFAFSAFLAALLPLSGRADPLTITTASLPNGMEMVPVEVQLEAAGGTAPYRWSTPGTVVAWGYNWEGQSTVPAGLADVVSIAAESYHSLALKSDGTVVAWGENGYGQTTVPADLVDVVSIAAGGYHNLALKSDGTVVAWGANWYGQNTVPVELSDVVSIAAGGYHNLALKSDRTIIAWGADWSGQSTVPAGLADVVGLAAGSGHSLALKSDGTVVAWGNNEDGQSSVPVGLADVVSIAAGDYHSLALKSDGTVVAWGADWYGQSTVPADLVDVVSIAAGGYHNLALKSDGTLIAWGANWDGQSSVPAALTNVVRIAAGGYHTMVVQAAGLPEGLRLQPSGRISGLPTLAGISSLDLLVQDRAGSYAAKTLSLTIDPNPNTRPVISSSSVPAGPVTVPENQSQVFSISANDPEGQPLTYIWTLNGEVVGGNQPSFDFSSVWGDAGTYQLSVEVQDDLWKVGTINRSWSITVPWDNDGDGDSNQFERDVGRDPNDPSDGGAPSVVEGVVRGSGDPLSGVVVEFRGESHWTVYGQSITDENGIFRVEGLRPGSYYVKAEAAGFIDQWSEGVNHRDDAIPYAVVSSETVLTGPAFDLNPGQGPAYAFVDSEPAGAEIILNGIPTGEVTPALIDLGQLPEPGILGSASHTLTLRKAGMATPEPLDFPAREGETVEYWIDLTEELAGSLYIDSVPQGAEVYVNVMDAPLGVTPLRVENLVAASGSSGHKIVLRKAGFLIPRPVLATVYEGETTEVLVPLTPDTEPDLQVTVASEPAGAAIYVDAIPAGKVSNVVLGGLDPASHGGDGWSSASHTLQLRDVAGYYPSVPVYLDPSGAGEQVVNLSLMEVPNEPPTITSASPAGTTLEQPQYSSASYSVTTQDPDSDPVTYVWSVDGVEQVGVTGSSFSYHAGAGSQGARNLQVVISDAHHPAAASRSWLVEVTNAPPVLDGRTPDQATVTIPARGSQTFSVNARDPEGQPLNYRWLVNGVERSGSGANFSYQPTAPEAGTRTVVCLVSDESHVDALQVQWTVEVQNRIEHPALGTLTWLGPNLFAHPGFGLIAFGNNGENLGVAWSFGLRTWLWIGADGSVFSTEYGELEVGADPEWLITSYFGYCYFNPLDELDGWVWTERFGWMRFEHTGSGAYLWVPKLLGWMAVLPGGDFYSFDYRSLDPQSLKNYVSQLFGPVTVGDPEGWIFSNHYGWIWGARGTNGKWFYTTQFGWVGVSDDGSNLWSVQQARWLK